ncbi:MAG: serine/threonine-protein kinase [Polyangiaceae bacterium]
MFDRLQVRDVGSASSCLSDEDIVAFALGRLPSQRLAATHAHLDECETCQHLLSEAAHVLGAAATAPDAYDTDDTDDTGLSFITTFQPGALVGRRYRIRHFIARGGMGEVYEAFDEDLQQRVALKTVTSTASDNANAVRRLKGEVQLARRVSHPNVCRIYDFGTHTMATTGAQICFLTMEFVNGETLGQCVRLGGALPLAEVRTLAKQLLLGLSAAHAAGVLHRDFKSDNVMLRTESDERVTPQILDFGLARALDHQSQHAASASQPSLVGTYGYIAPEQLEGKGYTTASDVYAFGVVWFEMLTGELPFDSRSSPAVAALQRLHRAAPAPSSRNPLVPSGLDAIVLRCLRRAPKDRFKTAEDVLAALEAYDERTRPIWQQRSRLGFGIAVCALGTWGYAAARQPAHQPQVAPLLRTLAAATPALPHPVSPAAAVSSQQAEAQGSSWPTSNRVPNGARRSAAPSATTQPTKRAQRAESRAAPRFAAAERAADAGTSSPAPATSGWEDPFAEGRAGNPPEAH